MNGRINVIKGRESLEVDIKNQVAIPSSMVGGDRPLYFVIVQWLGRPLGDQCRSSCERVSPDNQVRCKRGDLDVSFEAETRRSPAEEFNNILSLQI